MLFTFLFRFVCPDGWTIPTADDLSLRAAQWKKATSEENHMSVVMEKTVNGECEARIDSRLAADPRILFRHFFALNRVESGSFTEPATITTIPKLVEFYSPSLFSNHHRVPL
jgi:hypothetical protein